MKNPHLIRVWDNKLKCYHTVQNSLEMVMQAYKVLATPKLLELEPERFVLEFCSGKKDRDGVLVYEGDIIFKTASQMDYSYPLICEVIFDENFYQRIIEGKDGATKGAVTAIMNDFKIIGNIHQDSPLLNQNYLHRDKTV